MFVSVSGAQEERRLTAGWRIRVTNIGVEDSSCFIGVEPFPVAEGRISESLLGQGAKGIWARSLRLRYGSGYGSIQAGGAGERERERQRGRERALCIPISQMRPGST